MGGDQEWVNGAVFRILKGWQHLASLCRRQPVLPAPLRLCRHSSPTPKYPLQPRRGAAVVRTEVLDKLCTYLDCRLETQEEASGSTFKRMIR